MCALASTQAYKDQYRSKKNKTKQQKTLVASFCPLHNREWELFSSPSANVVVNQGSQWQWQWQPSLAEADRRKCPHAPILLPPPTPPNRTQNVPLSLFFSTSTSPPSYLIESRFSADVFTLSPGHGTFESGGGRSRDGGVGGFGSGRGENKSGLCLTGACYYWRRLLQVCYTTASLGRVYLDGERSPGRI